MAGVLHMLDEEMKKYKDSDMETIRKARDEMKQYKDSAAETLRKAQEEVKKSKDSVDPESKDFYTETMRKAMAALDEEVVDPRSNSFERELKKKFHHSDSDFDRLRKAFAPFNASSSVPKDDPLAPFIEEEMKKMQKMQQQLREQQLSSLKKEHESMGKGPDDAPPAAARSQPAPRRRFAVCPWRSRQQTSRPRGPPRPKSGQRGVSTWKASLRARMSSPSGLDCSTKATGH